MSARTSAVVASGLATWLAVATLPACAAGLAGEDAPGGGDTSPTLDAAATDAGHPMPGHDAGGGRPPTSDGGSTPTPADSGTPGEDADPGGFDAGNPNPGDDASGGGGGGGGGGDDSGGDDTGPIDPTPDTGGGGGGSSCAAAPAWSPNSVDYQVGQYVTYNGAVYVCITAHASQSDWSPAATPALWAPASCPDS